MICDYSMKNNSANPMFRGFYLFIPMMNLSHNECFRTAFPHCLLEIGWKSIILIDARGVDRLLVSLWTHSGSIIIYSLGVYDFK